MLEDGEIDDHLLDNHTIINLSNAKPNKSLNGSMTSKNSEGKLGRLQSQVEDVVDTMKANIEKVVDRGQSLDELNDRSENLVNSGDLFHKRSRNLRKSMWLRTCRARIYLGLTLGVILVLIICKLISHFR